MYLSTLDWPLEKKIFQLKYIISIMHTTQVRVYALLIKQIKKKPTSNPLMDQLHQIFFEFISKLLVRCWECCAKCAVHCLSHDFRVPLELKKKKRRKEKQKDSMLQGICSVIDHK